MTITDQIGNTIQLAHPPAKIVSLVPSQTELLHYLGLDNEVVGITKFCVHPETWFRSKKRVGGTKTVDIEKVRALQPDIIIANKEENVQEQVAALQTIAPVWVSDVNNLPDALEMISSIGLITGTADKAARLVNDISAAFTRLNKQTIDPPVAVAYLIWKDPYMTVGGDTFISHMLQACGAINVFAHLGRYPEVTVDVIRQSGCKVLLLSSEPYPFKEKHIAELSAQLPGVTIQLVDGEMFSWYGSRLLQSPVYFEKLISFWKRG